MLSSGTFHWARRRQTGRIGGVKVWIGITLLLGRSSSRSNYSTILAVVRVSSHAYGTMCYAMAGLH
jgi:heme/copper-type cytochrome/quinol oxidase subunit 3